jgi:hypothetical protein
MSNLYARLYDDMKAVTKADSGDDAAGPFAGLLVTGVGTLKVTTRQGTTVALAAVAVGQYIDVPIKLVWSTGSTATVVGLIGAPIARSF